MLFLKSLGAAMRSPIPLVIWFPRWPDEDRRVWTALFEFGGFLEESGPGASWTVATRRVREQGYGQWVSFLMRCDPAALVLPPTERVTEQRVGPYLVELKARIKPRSVYNLITALLITVQMLGPKNDWAWLKRAQRRLQAELSDVSVPAAKPVSAKRIFHHSLKRLEVITAGTDKDESLLKRAIHFRQSLLIAFLIARPVRRRALLAMEVDRHLTRSTEGFHLHFSAEDMKDKKSRDFPLPTLLVCPFKEYLAVHRPILLAGKVTSALWIGQYGNPITADGLSRELPKVVYKHLKVAMRPHAFRHVAATSIAETDPEHVGIIKDILGHATLDMAEKHYNRATGISSCNALQSIVEDIRANVPRIGRGYRDHREPGKR